MKKIDRATVVDIEKCIEKSGHNRFEVILAATHRTRELKARAKENDSFVTVVDSLLEIQDGKLNVTEYLNKVK